MKKSDLKKVIKPLVKECIQEVLLEEGLLSNVVSEVVKGMSEAPIVEQRSVAPRQVVREPNNSQLKEQRKQLYDSVTKILHNILE